MLSPYRAEIGTGRIEVKERERERERERDEASLA
jgi:hypothetical protein